VSVESVTARDGRRVFMRPLERDDRARLQAAFDRLSPESRYRRFLSPMPRLSAAQLDHLTDVDHHDHEALVALDESSERLIGVARFVRIEPTVAEPALTVADDWQRQGIGTALLEALAARALEENIAVFRGHFLSDNAAPLRLLEEIGDTEVRKSGAVSEVEVQLHEAASSPTGAGPLRTLLRAAAAGVLRPCRTL
jgi:GNAT superfamily N-acetyltransferase